MNSYVFNFDVFYPQNRHAPYKNEFARVPKNTELVFPSFSCSSFWSSCWFFFVLEIGSLLKEWKAFLQVNVYSIFCTVLQSGWMEFVSLHVWTPPHCKKDDDVAETLTIRHDA